MPPAVSLPLPATAIQRAAAIVSRRRGATNGDLVSGAEFGEPTSQNTIIYASYRTGFRSRQTVHGFRGLASTWANEAECCKSDWIEMALADADDDEVRGAYYSALYLSARRRRLPGFRPGPTRSRALCLFLHRRNWIAKLLVFILGMTRTRKRHRPARGSDWPRRMGLQFG